MIKDNETIFVLYLEITLVASGLHFLKMSASLSRLASAISDSLCVGADSVIDFNDDTERDTTKFRQTHRICLIIIFERDHSLLCCPFVLTVSTRLRRLSAKCLIANEYVYYARRQNNYGNKNKK